MHKTNDPTRLVFVCFPGGGWASLFTSRVGLLRGGWASLLVQILAVTLAPGVDLPLQYGVRFLLLVTVVAVGPGVSGSGCLCHSSGRFFSFSGWASCGPSGTLGRFGIGLPSLGEGCPRQARQVGAWPPSSSARLGPPGLKCGHSVGGRLLFLQKFLCVCHGRHLWRCAARVAMTSAPRRPCTEKYDTT